MKKRITKFIWIFLGFTMIAEGFPWLNALQVSGPYYALATVPAPRLGQKKVILKDLHMA